MTKTSLEKQESSKNDDSKDFVGVPLLLVNSSGSPEDVLCAIFDNSTAKLPSPEEVVCLDAIGLARLKFRTDCSFYAFLIPDIGQSRSWSSEMDHPQSHDLSVLHVSPSTTINTSHQNSALQIRGSEAQWTVSDTKYYCSVVTEWFHEFDYATSSARTIVTVVS